MTTVVGQQGPPAGWLLRVLGPMELSAAGVVLPLGGPKQRAVLAALAIQPHRVVPTEALISAVWDEDPPSDAAGSIQVTISALRRILRPLAADGGPDVATVGGGYRLVLAPQSLDLELFRADRRRTDQLFAEHRFDLAAQAAASALSWWRGAALQDLERFRFAADFAAGMEEERLAVVALHLDAELACGRQHATLPELIDLTTKNPLHEPFWARLAVALYRTGRQADALDALRRIRQLLADELGIDPGPELQRLENQVLRQDAALDLALSRNSLSTGAAPAGAAPAGAAPTGAVPIGAIPMAAVPTDAVPTGAVPTGALPTGVVATGAMQVGVASDAQSPNPALLGATVTEHFGDGTAIAELTSDDGVVIAVPPTGLRMGRAPDNDLVVHDTKVSRFHATVVATAAGPVVGDLHSTNGTWVNAERVSASQLLRHGDSLRVGDTSFVVQIRQPQIPQPQIRQPQFRQPQ